MNHFCCQYHCIQSNERALKYAFISIIEVVIGRVEDLFCRAVDRGRHHHSFLIFEKLPPIRFWRALFVWRAP